jgi:hypothetical protein
LFGIVNPEVDFLIDQIDIFGDDGIGRGKHISNGSVGLFEGGLFGEILLVHDAIEYRIK